MNDESSDEIARTLGLAGTGKLKPHLRRWLVWGAIGATTLLLALLWSLWGGNDTTTYATQAIARGDLTMTVSATGNLVPTNQVDVGIEVSGTIKTVAVDYNDKVAIGDVLAQLDTTKLRAQLLQSQAALDSAKAKVLQAEASIRESSAQLARMEQVRKLSGGKVPSKAEMDSAIATLARARADGASARAVVSQTKANLEGNRSDLSKAVVHSPINGVVLTRSVEPGQTVAATFQAPVLFRIAEDLAKMELQVDVDEADVGSVQSGQSATFTVDAYPDREYPAHITKIYYGAQTLEGVVTYKAVLEIDNTDLSLRPGMTANAIIAVKRVEDALLVPDTALRFAPPQPGSKAPSAGLAARLLPRRPRDQNNDTQGAQRPGRQQQVWILRDGEPVPIEITTGPGDGVMTQLIGGGLEEGSVVITGIAR